MCGSIPRDDRSGAAEVEVIVHAGADDVELRLAVVARLEAEVGGRCSAVSEVGVETVSYTHLTLPTIYSV